MSNQASSRYAATVWRSRVIGGILGSLALMPAAQAAENVYDGNWHFSLTPYLWLPSIDGELTFVIPPGSSGGPNGGSVDVGAGSEEILASLNFAFMGTGDVRKGRWSLVTDFIYLDLSVDKTDVKSITGPGGIIDIPIDTSSKTSLSGYIWTLAGAYSLATGPGATLDLLAGFRDAQLEVSLEWQFAGPVGSFPQSGGFSNVSVLWDAIVGVKGRIRLSESGNWFIPYYADVGTGASDFTWQGVIGVGYSFGWGDLHLDYRALGYKIDDGRLIKDLTLHGPALAATFHF
jgi:hypothetical protein